MKLFEIDKNVKAPKHKSTKTLNKAIIARIRQVWLVVWVSSYCYYILGDSWISDTEWDKWAKELVDLKAKYPDEAKSIKHYDIFADFDGSTGFIIAHKATPNLIKRAKQQLAYHKEHNK